MTLTDANTPRTDANIDGGYRIRTKHGCPRDVGIAYITTKPVGRGAYGVVYHARRNKVDVAVKTVR